MDSLRELWASLLLLPEAAEEAEEAADEEADEAAVATAEDATALAATDEEAAEPLSLPATPPLKVYIYIVRSTLEGSFTRRLTRGVAETCAKRGRRKTRLETESVNCMATTKMKQASRVLRKTELDWDP